MLKIGRKAPSFKLLDEDGNPHTLKQYLGKKVVIYFYIKDNMLACTKQAGGYTDRMEHFKQYNTVVIGISKDDVASHKLFKKKHGISFTLLSDPELKVAQDYEVCKTKVVGKQKTLCVVRSSFFIDEKGYLREALYNVKAEENPEEMLECVEQ
jgi:peroxiredoxin Q/BCP